MKKNLLVIFIITLFVSSGCFFPVRTTRVIGSGTIITETRRVAGFSAVDLSGIGTLIVEQGRTESLEITAEENIVPYLESMVNGKELQLGVRDFVTIDPGEEIVYHLTVKDLERIETSGLGNVEIHALETEDLFIKISGSGSTQIDDLQADTVRIEISGLGNIDISGEAQEQKVELSGAGNYEAGDLYSEEARIEISGTGKSIIWVESDLDAELSGMGDLKYYGNPVLSTEISGIGNVQSLGTK